MALLALIAATVSYLHMHMLVELHGQPGWVAALTPFSVDGMIVAASTTLLADSRSGGRGGLIPWALLVVGSVASLGANVAVAEPTAIGRVIAAWPSFALIGAYEMLMRQVRRAAAVNPDNRELAPVARRAVLGSAQHVAGEPRRDLQRQAWHWAQANRSSDGSFPSGRQIAEQFGRHERWGRLVKRSGCAGEFAPDSNPGEPKTPAPSTAAAVDRPGNLGGSDPWEDAESCRHSGSTPMSCVSARSGWSWRSGSGRGRAMASWPGLAVSWVFTLRLCAGG